MTIFAGKLATELENIEAGLALPVMEEFYTLQGEGYHVGKAAYFIRVGGCDIGCAWCDTKLSWEHGVHPVIPVADIIQRIKDTPANALVMTGGEPTQYNLNRISEEARKANIKLFLETSGTYALTGRWDWICLSPKRHNTPRPEYFKKANELKVIVQSERDIEWAASLKEQVNDDCLLFLQPEWSRHEKVSPYVIDFIKANPDWRISIQAHKFLHIP